MQSIAQFEKKPMIRQALGLGVAGVDLIAGPDGPLVLELNASPGLRGIEGATGVDVAMAMVRFAMTGSQRHAA